MISISRYALHSCIAVKAFTKKVKAMLRLMQSDAMMLAGHIFDAMMLASFQHCDPEMTPS